MYYKAVSIAALACMLIECFRLNRIPTTVLDLVATISYGCAE